MLAKQALIDLGIVLLAPVVVIGSYIIWGGPDDTALLSAPPTETVNLNEPGVKTQNILGVLSGTRLDDSLFKDEAFTSLTAFNVTIPEVPLLRDYPFTPPPIIEERLRQARLGQKYGASQLPTTSTADVSQKIDTLKKSLTGK